MFSSFIPDTICTNYSCYHVLVYNVESSKQNVLHGLNSYSEIIPSQYSFFAYPMLTEYSIK